MSEAAPSPARVATDPGARAATRPARSAVRRWGLALLGGASIAASFLDFSLWPLAWVAFVPILLALAQPVERWSAARVGLIAGLATNVPAFAWLVHTIHLFGGFPVWLSIVFYLGLSVYSAVEFVLWALAVRRLGFGPLALYPALVWVTLEFFYPNLFPWRLADSQAQHPILLQIGDLTGPFGLSFVIVWASAAVASAIDSGVHHARTALWCSGAAVVAILLYGAVRVPAIERAVAAAPSVRLGLVQGDLSIEEKHDVRYLEGNLETYRRLSDGLTPAPDLIIWPESVINEPLPRTLRSLSPAGRQILGLRRPLLAGALTYEEGETGTRFYNSVVLFDADGRVLGMSDKQILMPFGEYMPFASVFPWLKRISPQTGDFQAGSGVVPLEVPGGPRVAPLNCYEDLRAKIARRATRDGAAEILVAVANDGWFGDTMAPFQHEALALWRAVENRRFLVRVTNTGVTDVIDPVGRVVLRFPVFRAYAAVAQVHRLHLASPYTALGDWFAWIVTAWALAALLSSAARPNRSELPTPPRRRG